MAPKKQAAKKSDKNAFMMNTLFIDANGKTPTPKKGLVPTSKKKK